MLLAGTIYIRLLIYLKAIYEQNMREIDFFSYYHENKIFFPRFFLAVPLKID